MLKLSDWRVTAVWVKGWPECIGLSVIDPEHKSSLIQLCDSLRICPCNHNTDRDLFQNAEVTLVHELMHLHFDFLGFPGLVAGKRPPLREQLFEQAIEQTARIIVEQHRRSR